MKEWIIFWTVIGLLVPVTAYGVSLMEKTLEEQPEMVRFDGNNPPPEFVTRQIMKQKSLVIIYDKRKKSK